MRISAIVVGGISVLLAAASAGASTDPNQRLGAELGEQSVQRWQVGFSIRAVGGPCMGIFATLPVPDDWPEQQVRIVDEEISPFVRSVQYRNLAGGVRQMLVTIPQLPAGETAEVTVTFEVDRHLLLPDPSIDVDELRIPNRVPRELGRYLAPSPYIESRHARIRTLAREIVQEHETAWEQVEAIYDWVREHVVYENSRLKGALAALNDGTGDCEELSSLFIALCRANRIPARTVWVPDHCYPEFYLEDATGNGYWFPAQAAGDREFGYISERRPILQKGDSFEVPEKRGAQRYVAEFLRVRSVGGSQQPQVIFERRLLD